MNRPYHGAPRKGRRGRARGDRGHDVGSGDDPTTPQPAEDLPEEPQPLSPEPFDAESFDDEDEVVFEPPSGRPFSYAYAYAAEPRPGDYERDTNPESPEGERVERQLAHYAFVREEDDREVRLYFRDVPAHEIAAAFRAQGAILITLTGERAPAQQNSQPAFEGLSPERDDAATHRARRDRDRRRRTAAPPPRTGEVTMRYFYALGESVYTIVNVSPTGVIESVAGVYPVAAGSEREMQDRLSVVFRHSPTHYSDLRF